MATTATLTVQGIVDALDSTDGVLPCDALEQAIARWDEVAPVLVPRIEVYADGRDRSDQAVDLAFYGLYLMAQQRDTRAFRLLCTLLLTRWHPKTPSLTESPTRSRPCSCAPMTAIPLRCGP
jgi:hypothetical protein